jgi:hypothetical protein
MGLWCQTIEGGIDSVLRSPESTDAVLRSPETTVFRFAIPGIGKEWGFFGKNGK